MDGTYCIDIEPKRGLLRLTLSGFFSLEGVERLAAERAVAVDKLGCAPNQHLTICDISAMKIAAQDVAEMLSKMVGDPRYASRRLAMVTGSSLARGQARRVAKRDNVGHFDTLAEAEAWLFG